MSESSFPFGGPAEVEPQADPAQDGDRRKPLLLVGGLVGALVLGAGAFLLTSGGGDDDLLASGVPARPTQSLESQAAEPEVALIVPAASTDSVGRNPFKARYVAPEAAPAAEEPAPAPPVVNVEFTAPPAPLPLPQQPVVIVQQPAPPAPDPAHAEYPITLKGIEPTGPSGITYTWTIDGKDLDVFQAQRFGLHGELVVLALESAEDGPRAVLQVGDATPIRVKVGETVTVL